MVVKHDFIYSPKGTNRPLHIYLPDGYFESEERYPVMYFFDGHNLFSDEVKKNEIKVYMSKMNRYGVPLDSRSDYTKVDWLMWSTCIWRDKEYFDAVCQSIVNMINETLDRVPLTDFYFTSTADYKAFKNRSVVGGLFINLLD